ncbi:chorismate lyase [Spiribacter sp. C176]|uniref:Probable chorismate pyruvate-lyase n=1 Tax=Spiribacter salilacus TaxID=2664894 RepID=A0A6N7QRJ1_9GAMM|nr:chorismate lyase [Spiribacter salilacus]MRH78053.1 chorismate lyase [Spiribacter salilacus]
MSEPGTRGWRPRRLSAITAVPKKLKPWLDEPGSLTRRLRGIAGQQFRVRVIRECWVQPWPDERARLAVREPRKVWLREVELCRGSTPLVYARSIIPVSSLHGPLRRFRRLGARPLGALLFGRYPVARGPIEVAPVPRESRLGLSASFGGKATSAWARRSIFRIGGRPLLITEVFLPALLEELTNVG